MKLNRILVTVMAAVVFTAFGCAGTGASGSSAEPASDPAAGSTEQQADADAAAANADAANTGATAQTASQNPVMKYAGAYKEENTADFNLMLEDLDGIDGVHITVVKSSPEEPYVYWEANGVIDKDLKVTYTDAVKGQIVITETGETEETLFYEDGTGSVQIGQDGKVTWQDDKEDAGKDCIFIFDQALTDELMTMNSEDTQDPLLNWTGPYTDSSTIGRSMVIEVLEENPSLCRITITNEEENMAVTQWIMQGEFNEAEMTIEYKDCRKIRGTTDQSGKVTEEETLYENGTGRLVISMESDTIEWVDDVEDMGNGSVFVFNYDYSGFSDDGSTGAEAVPEEDAEFLEDYYEDEDVEEEDLEYGEDDDSNDTSVDEE